MTTSSTRDRLRRELRYVARCDIYGIELARIPVLAGAATRLTRENRSASLMDVRHVLAVAIKAVAAGDSGLETIALWSFGVPAESRRYNLSQRQKVIGPQVGRSSSSIRQTDLPHLIDRLCDFLLATPPGSIGPSTRFRSALGGRREEALGIRLLTLALHVLLDPLDYTASPLTVVAGIEALRRVDTFYWGFEGAIGYSHRCRPSSPDGRLVYRADDALRHLVDLDAAYQVEPAWTPGERYEVNITHEYHQEVAIGNEQKLHRRHAIGWDSIAELALLATTPTDEAYAPQWYIGPSGIARIAPACQDMPLLAEANNRRTFGITVEGPAVGDLCGVLIRKPK